MDLPLNMALYMTCAHMKHLPAHLYAVCICVRMRMSVCGLVGFVLFFSQYCISIAHRTAETILSVYTGIWVCTREKDETRKYNSNTIELSFPNSNFIHSKWNKIHSQYKKKALKEKKPAEWIEKAIGKRPNAGNTITILFVFCVWFIVSLTVQYVHLCSIFCYNFVVYFSSFQLL